MKKYVSILQLVSDMHQYIMQNKHDEIPIHWPPRYHGESGPIFQITETEDGYERLVLLRAIGSLRAVNQILAPYPLELEYLRTSDYPFSESDLEKLHQLLLLQYIQWIAIVGTHIHGTGHYGTNITRMQYCDDNIFLSLLNSVNEEDIQTQEQMSTDKSDDEVLHYLITGEDTPSAEWVEAELQKRYYARNIEPLDYSISWYAKKHAYHWYAAPISSVDVLNILNVAYKLKNDIKDRGTMLGHMLLFLPMFLTFSLLERKTKAFQSINWNRYTAYQQLALSICTTTQDWNTADLDGFTYGYVSSSERYQRESDLIFVSRMVSQYFRKMKELAVDQNVSLISVADTAGFKRIEADKCQVLLNVDTLTWEEETEDE